MVISFGGYSSDAFDFSILYIGTDMYSWAERLYMEVKKKSRAVNFVHCVHLDFSTLFGGGLGRWEDRAFEGKVTIFLLNLLIDDQHGICNHKLMQTHGPEKCPD